MKKRLVIFLVLLAAGAAVGGYFYFEDRLKGPENVIRVSGNFEVTDVALSFRLPGWVLERPVDEGMTVRGPEGDKPGTLIARLDDIELQRQLSQQSAELDTARAALAEQEAGSRPEEIAAAESAALRAKAALAELEHGSRPEEIAAAEADSQAAAVEEARTKLDYERLDKLKKEGVAGPQEYDTARYAYNSAKARLDQTNAKLKLVKEGPRQEEIDQARAALKELQDRYELVKKGPRQEDIDQARSRVRQLEFAVKLIQTRLGFATLYSPVSGVVLSKNTEAGEFVAAGTPIVTVADLHDIWLRAYVDEPDLSRVKLGQKVRVTTDAYPGNEYWGTITFIADQAEFTPKNVQTPKERVKLVYRVKITVPNPKLELKPGMPADAVIRIAD